ncbi:MAG: pyridoxamine 5'-phosphate oxidase [Actinomycetota bacterium]
MADLASIERLVPGEHGLATISLVLPNGTAHASVVNAGVLDHPVTGDPVVGFVVRGNSYKLRRLRADSRVTVSFRVGWNWAAVVGEADIIGPEDQFDGFDPAGVPQLLRDVFIAAGGDHDDWDEYDRVMAAEARTALLVRPNRFLGNQVG